MTITPSAVRPAGAPARVSRAAPPGRRLLPPAVDVLCALVAIAVALEAFLRLRRRLGSELHGSSDIIGYPAFHDFNASLYFDTFYLGIVGGPAIALAVFGVLRWAVGRLVPASVAPPRPLLPSARLAAAAPGGQRPAKRRPGVVEAVGAVSALLATGAVLGVEVAVERAAAGGTFWPLVGATCAAYTAAALVLGAVTGTIAGRIPALRCLTRTYASRVAVIGALGACLPVAGLWAVAHVTSITSGDGAVHRYPWLGLPLALGLSGLGVAAVAAALWRGRAEAGRAVVVARRTVLVVAVPTLIFLALAGLYAPGATPMNVFEQGQQIATVHFLQQGMVPYRDFISDHGLFEDTIKLLLGARAIENSAWGMVAGETLVVIPMYFVALYYLGLRISGRAAFALFIAVLLLHRNAVPVHDRFLLWPIVLIALWLALDSRRPWAAAPVGALTVSFAVLVPESGFCGFAIGAAVIAADAYRADPAPGRRLRSLSMSLWWLAGCAVTLATTAVVLARLGALRGLVGYLQGAAADHMLTGALPLQPMVPPYSTWAILPVVGVLLAVLILAVKLRARVVLGTEDFVMVAAAVMTVLYYQKFTSRADGHVENAYAAAVPLLMIVGHQLLCAADRVVDLARSSWRLRRPASRAAPMAVAALVVGVVTAPVGLQDTIGAIPAHVMVATPLAHEASPSLGWFARDPATPALQAFLSRYLAPGAVVYDFTNAPGLLYYTLGYTPGARHYTIATAYTLAEQHDVIADLERTRPRIIAFWGIGYLGLPAWDDIVNQVRSYAVSQWILDHYRPLALVGANYVLYADRDLPAPGPPTPEPPASAPAAASTGDLYFREGSCDWGYAPEFLAIPHPSAGVEARVTARSADALTLGPPPGHRWADYHWIELESAGPHFAQDDFTLRDAPDTPGIFRAVTFRTLARGVSAYRFPLGACAQWHGYGAAPLQLTDLAGSDVAGVRLLP